MGKVNFQPYLLMIARFVLAAVFIGAAIPKLLDPLAFSASIEGYRVVSGSLALWVAIILPWLELIVGIGILTSWLRMASGAIMAFLLIVFIVLHVSAWARGLDVSCGCFGESAATQGYPWLILRNVILWLLAIWILAQSIVVRSESEISK